MSIYTKRGVWYYRIMYQGKVYQGRIGEVPKSVAREIETRKKSDIISGVHIPEKVKRMENITTSYGRRGSKDSPGTYGS